MPASVRERRQTPRAEKQLSQPLQAAYCTNGRPKRRISMAPRLWYTGFGVIEMAIKPKPFAQQKLLVLYILHRAGLPLTNGQLVQLTGENGWINYFDLQQFLAELWEAGLIQVRREEGIARYSPAASGVEALDYFKTRVSPTLREQVDEIIEKARPQLQLETDLQVSIEETEQGAYRINCAFWESGVRLMSLAVYASTLTQALQMENAFRQNAPALYEQALLSLNQ